MKEKCAVECRGCKKGLKDGYRTYTVAVDEDTMEWYFLCESCHKYIETYIEKYLGEDTDEE